MATKKKTTTRRRSFNPSRVVDKVAKGLIAGVSILGVANALDEGTPNSGRISEPLMNKDWTGVLGRSKDSVNAFRRWDFWLAGLALPIYGLGKAIISGVIRIFR